jgi:hypothetical protein
LGKDQSVASAIKALTVFSAPSAIWEIVAFSM